LGQNPTWGDGHNSMSMLANCLVATGRSRGPELGADCQPRSRTAPANVRRRAAASASRGESSGAKGRRLHTSRAAALGAPRAPPGIQPLRLSPSPRSGVSGGALGRQFLANHGVPLRHGRANSSGCRCREISRARAPFAALLNRCTAGFWRLSGNSWGQPSQSPERWTFGKRPPPAFSGAWRAHKAPNQAPPLANRQARGNGISTSGHNQSQGRQPLVKA